MKCKLIFFLLFFALLPFASALSSLNPPYIYVGLNETYTFALASDNSSYDINMFLNGTQFDVNWSGSQYEIELLFSAEADYPFIVNSTDFSGQMLGMFIVRVPFYVTFELQTEPDWLSFIFGDDYINDYAYITAEFSNRPVGSPFNNYNPTLEKYIHPISSDYFRKPVFHTEYESGFANLTLYEEESYAFRMIDGQIEFPYKYSYPNVSKSYGTNIYLGKYTLNQSGRDFIVLIDDSDLHPYRHLVNWIYIILLIVCVIGSAFIFFMFPQFPAISLTFGLGGSAILTILRIALWFGGV